MIRLLSASALGVAIVGCFNVEGQPDPSLAHPVSFDASASFRLDSVVVEIGRGEGSPEDVLSRVTYPRFSGRDRILVPNERREVRIYSTDGNRIATVGGAGDGPGEFRNLWNVYSTEDGFLAFDSRAGRVSWFDQEGGLLRTDAFERRTEIPEGLHAPDATTFFGAERDPPDLGTAGTSTQFAAVFRTDTAGRSTNVLEGLVASVLQVGRDGQQPVWNSIPFSPGLHVGSGAGHVFVVEGGEARVHLLDQAGDLKWSIDAAVARQPVTETLRDAWCEAQRCVGPGRPIAPEFPELLPAVGRIAVAGDGSQVWLQAHEVDLEPSDEAEWFVVGASGRALMRVSAPAALRITDVREDQVLGVFTDGLGVQTVRVYRLSGEGV